VILQNDENPLGFSIQFPYFSWNTETDGTEVTTWRDEIGFILSVFVGLAASLASLSLVFHAMPPNSTMSPMPEAVAAQDYYLTTKKIKIQLQLKLSTRTDFIFW